MMGVVLIAKCDIGNLSKAKAMLYESLISL